MEGISTKDEETKHELRVCLKLMVVTAKPAQTEELRVADRELGVFRMGGEVKV